MPETLAIDRENAAVIIMDYQMRHLSFLSEAAQQELLGRARSVLTKARNAGVPVINIEVVRGERTPETAIHPAVAPAAGETLLTKSTVGPLTSTPLDLILRRDGITTMVIMGISTSGCVLSLVRAAADLGYRLVVLSDCCVDRDEELQRVLMGKLFPRQATVATAQDFVQALA